MTIAASATISITTRKAATTLQYQALYYRCHHCHFITPFSAITTFASPFDCHLVTSDKSEKGILFLILAHKASKKVGSRRNGA